MHEGAAVYKPTEALDLGHNFLVCLLDIHAGKICDLRGETSIVVDWNGQAMRLV